MRYYIQNKKIQRKNQLIRILFSSLLKRQDIYYVLSCEKAQIIKLILEIRMRRRKQTKEFYLRYTIARM